MNDHPHSDDLMVKMKEIREESEAKQSNDERSEESEAKQSVVLEEVTQKQTPKQEGISAPEKFGEFEKVNFLLSDTIKLDKIEMRKELQNNYNAFLAGFEDSMKKKTEFEEEMKKEMKAQKTE